MTLHDWIFSIYPENSAIQGQWGILHIATLLLCAALIAGIAYLLRSKSDTARQTAIVVLAAVILLFEITRRVINLSRGYDWDWHYFWYVMLPRPWCAISCWMTVAAAITKKRFLYNFSAMNGLLCALVFFAYPSVGFNDRYILFENVYSISTHSLLLITSVLMMLFGLTDFSVKRANLLKETALLCGVYAYAFAEIFWLKIEPDPLFFMPNNQVQTILGLPYGWYLVVYAVFLAFYFTLFHIVQHILDKQKKNGSI